ncbi:unnamed protein product, partial [Protopolystoma xenopodis]
MPQPYNMAPHDQLSLGISHKPNVAMTDFAIKSTSECLRADGLSPPPQTVDAAGASHPIESSRAARVTNLENSHLPLGLALSPTRNTSSPRFLIVKSDDHLLGIHLSTSLRGTPVHVSREHE